MVKMGLTRCSDRPRRPSVGSGLHEDLESAVNDDTGVEEKLVRDGHRGMNGCVVRALLGNRMKVALLLVAT